MFKSVYGPLVDRPLPAEWITRARQRSRPRMNFALAGANAATLAVLAGAPLVWEYSAVLTGKDVVDVALAAREGTTPKTELIATDGSPKVERYDTALRQAGAAGGRGPGRGRGGGARAGRRGD